MHPEILDFSHQHLYSLIEYLHALGGFSYVDEPIVALETLIEL